jgi:hypothetical protein
LQSDHYRADVILATDLPSIWFPKSGRERAEKILGRSRAVASVSGDLRPDAHERADEQTLLVFIVEMPSAEETAELQHLMEADATGEPATVSVNSGVLFALAVGRSFVVDVASYETRTSIRRFEPALSAALQKAARR